MNFSWGVLMEYYDAHGKKATRKTKTRYYYDEDGKLTTVPTMADSRNEILDYLEACVQTEHPGVTREDLETAWGEQLQRLQPVLDYLEVLRTEYLEAGDRWRMISYSKAIKALKAVEVPIVSGKQAQKLRGIGSGIAKKIDEVLKTGGLRIVDVQAKEKIEEQAEKRRVMDLFQTIWNVGPAKAKQWYQQGYRTLEEIRKYEYSTLSEAQKETLKFNKQLREKIPRDEITHHKEFWEAPLYAIDTNAKFEIAGSYRRGASSSGDIDILITSKHNRDTLDRYIEALEDEGDIIYILQRSKNKVTTLAQMMREPEPRVAKIDFFYVPWDSWGTGLVAWTGSGEFVRAMRAEASREGYKLSEKDLTVKKTGRVIKTPTEESVFKALGMKYVPPEKRY